MYVCQECKSTEFEKVDGFLYCIVCQVQQKDFIEYINDTDPTGGTWSPGSRRVVCKRRLPNTTKLTENWTPWDAYNHILLGLMKEFTDTGLAPKKLHSTVLSIWMGYLAKTVEQSKKSKKKKSAKKNTSKTKFIKKKIFTKKRSNRNIPLMGDWQLIHADKKQMIAEGQKYSQETNNIYSQLSQSSSCSMKQIEKRMIEKHYQDFLLSEENRVTDVFAHETIETIGKHLNGDPSMSHISQAAGSISYQPTSNEKGSGPQSGKRRWKKTIPMCKGRALEMLHLGLLMCGSDVQLSDLLRFIREAHISYAKVTQHLPPEIKLTRENYSYLETVRDCNMPSHVQQRKLGAYVAKILGIEELPVPDLSRLIKRYVSELRLPVMIASYATLFCQIADVESLCSFKGVKRIPNYEGMAAACIIVALKFLFGLDDKTEFLLSDMAKKTNKLLKEKTKSDSVKLFRFQEWKKLIELRKTVLSAVHYPTQEKLDRHPSANGFLETLVKESKDPHRAERFETYQQYYIKRELLDVCKEILESLSEPKEVFTMNFPPTLKPQTEYLQKFLRDYDERNKKKEPGPGYNQFSKITERAMTLLVKHYEKRQVFFMHNPEEYKELLRKNGYKVKTLSKRDQIKIMGGSRFSDEESEDSSWGTDGEDVPVSDAESKRDNDSYSEEGAETISQNETGDDRMEICEEEFEIKSEDSEEKEKLRHRNKKKGAETNNEKQPYRRNWTKIFLNEDGKESTYYVGRPENSSYTKIERMPKSKCKDLTWSNIRYKELYSSRNVYFVEDMAVIWKLNSPWLTEECNRYFMHKVFEKTPQNFQWIVRQFAIMLEMKVRDVYLECYRLEAALEKARKLPLSKIHARIQ